MPVTLEQIAAAPDALALQRLQTQIQLEDSAAYRADLAANEAHRTKAEAEWAAAAAARAAHAEHDKAVEAFQARVAAAAEAQLAAFQQQATAFDVSERGKVIESVFTALVGKYMTAGTATDPNTQLTDATRDANYLKVAVQQVMGVYDALRTA